MGKLKIIFVFLVLLCVVLSVSVLIVPSYINWNNYKGVIENKITEYTGYEVEIVGDVELQILPNPKIYIGKTNVKAFSGDKNLAEIERIIAYKSLAELFALDMSVNEMIINRPTINLEVIEDGKFNWEPNKLRNNSYYQRKAQGIINNIKNFKRVKIENFSLTYNNKPKSKQNIIKNAYLDINSEEGSTVKSSLKFDYNNESYKTFSKLDLRDLYKTPLEMEFNGESFKLAVKGTLDNLNRVSKLGFFGRINLEAADLGEIGVFESAIVNNLEKYVDLSAVNIETDFSYIDKKASFPKFDIKTRDNDLAGSLVWQGASPEDKSMDLIMDIESLVVKKVDVLKNYSFSDMVEIVQGSPVIRDIKMGMAISCKKCVYSDVVLDDINFRANLENNSLIVNQFNIRSDTGGANISAVLSLNSPINFEVKNKFNDFAIHKYAPKFISDKLETKLTGELNFSSRGDTVDSIASNLSGSISLKLSDLAFLHANPSDLKKLVGGVLSEKVKSNKTASIDEAVELEGFIKDGVLRHSNIDFNMNGRSYTTKGKLDIANLTLNYRVSPVQMNENHLGVIVKGKLINPEIIEDKITPNGIVDGYGRLITTEITKDEETVKTPFDFNDTTALKENVTKFLFEE